MSTDVEKDHRIWISQKNTKEKSLGKASPLTVTFHLILFISISNSAISFLTTENIEFLLAESPVVIFQTPKHVQDMSDFNMTSNPHGYLALFELKSTVIFICFCCLIISFKLCKIT